MILYRFINNIIFVPNHQNLEYFKFGTILRSAQNVGVASITDDRFPYYGIFES